MKPLYIIKYIILRQYLLPIFYNYIKNKKIKFFFFQFSFVISENEHLFFWLFFEFCK